MPKKYNIKEFILKILEEKELSKKKILEEIREKSDRLISVKTLNETLMGLLKERKVDISGYDFDIYEGIKRIQSIKPDGIIFSLVKTDPIEINILLKQLESNNLDEVKKASDILKRAFKRKIREIEDLEDKAWKELNRKVKCEPLEAFLKKVDEESDNANLKKELLEIHRWKRDKMYVIADVSIKNKKHLNPKLTSEITFYRNIEENGVPVREKTGSIVYKIPTKRDIGEINALFNQTIYFIHSQTQDQKRILRHRLAWGLSNEKGSFEIFENIIETIKSESR